MSKIGELVQTIFVYDYLDSGIQTDIPNAYSYSTVLLTY